MTTTEPERVAKDRGWSVRVYHAHGDEPPQWYAGIFAGRPSECIGRSINLIGFANTPDEAIAAAVEDALATEERDA